MKVRAGGSWNSTVNSWVKINGEWYEFGGGSAGFAEIQSWTSAPTTTTWSGVIGTRKEEDYIIYKWVNDAQITVAKTGIVDILCIAAGGRSWGSTGPYGTAGGAGGITFLEGVYLEEGKTYSIEVGSVSSKGGEYLRNSQEGGSYFAGVYAVAGADGSAYYNRSTGGGACGGINPGSDGRGNAPHEPSGGMSGQGFVGSDGTYLTRGGVRNSGGLPSGGAGPSGDSGGGWTSLPSWGQNSAVFGIGQGASGHNTAAGTGNAGATGCVIIRTKNTTGASLFSDQENGLNELAVAVVSTDSPVDGYFNKPVVRYKILIPDDKTTEQEILDYANSITLVWKPRGGDKLVVYPHSEFGVGSYYHEDVNIFGGDPDRQPHPDFDWDDEKRVWVQNPDRLP
jgi:hypothetical protein